MLNNNQIELLKYLVKNDFVLSNAEYLGVTNPLASVGVAEFLLGDDQNFQKMSPAQKYHYETVIEPLLKDVPCDGMIGDYEDGSSSCQGDGYIDEETLVGAYIDGDMRCQHCLSATNLWEKNND